MSQIKGQIRLMKKYEDPPQFIILHVAGNNLGLILIELPNTTIIWSQILSEVEIFRKPNCYE